MDFYKASEKELRYIKYEKSYIHNTALIASIENKVIGVLEYDIKNIEEAQIVSLNMVQAYDEITVIKGFIDEIAYWNPHLKRIFCNVDNNFINKDSLINARFVKSSVWTFSMDNHIKAFKINIEDITPEQLTVDKVKLERVSSWIDKPEDVVVCCVRIGDKVVSIDGHSRLVAAYNKGFGYVYAYMEPDNDSIEFFETCLRWCEEQKIFGVKDLSNRVVTSEEHEKIWISRCQEYLKNKQKEIG